MESRHSYKEILPVATMVVAEFCGVGLNTLFKAASLKGMSYFVFLFYSNMLNTLLLVPIPFYLCSRRMVSLFKFPLLSRIFALGIIGLFAQLIGYKGIKYTSPTMASAMSNLTPGWTFLFAVIFRMEKLSWSSSSTQIKIIGTVVSILGALMVVLYKGPKVLSSSSSISSILLSQESSQSNWVVGGFLLAVQHILYSFLYILQTQMVQICPSPLLVSFSCYLYTTIISAPVCFIAEPDLNAWRLRPDITLVALVYAGILGGASLGIVHLWCLQMKGPVFVATFRPLSIAIAAAMAAVFLGDALHLGSMIGAVMISIGVYAVIWGKAKEEVKAKLFSSGTTPLLQEHKVEDSLNKRTDEGNHQFVC
ncbi:WAT1-related protein At5g40240 [Ricinus communis]|uniref:WAT1-related protein n=1 Tax=Ricinus communis TaxID=3988 RepID=B9RUC7_RICCO|nr:WAT1-related protein At5g40240 [Ricinus communis]EEF44914.1 Auxin-induced protein 5NG4, putative [Ricinus communis]|eukprot:XP_002517372.1 WAT1-related protein At5g40240 [Ricinus communis]